MLHLESTSPAPRFEGVQAIRWRNNDAVAGLLRPRSPGAPGPDLDLLGDVRVTAADYKIGVIAPETGEATVEASFDYYFVDSVSIRHVTQRAVWWHEAESGRWFLDGGLPDFVR